MGGVCDNPVAGTACTYQDSCTAPGGDTRIVCDAKGNGIAAGNPGFCAQLLQPGLFVNPSKSNTESDMADVDVGAVAAPVEALSTSGSAARAASYFSRCCRMCYCYYC